MTVFKWSETSASNANADSSINWAEGQAPSSVNDSARAMMAAIKKWFTDLSGNTETAGTNTAYTFTSDQHFTSLIDGIYVEATMHADNGAAPTLAVDGLTAKAINVATDVPVPAGVLSAGSRQGFVYNLADDIWYLKGYITPQIVNRGYSPLTSNTNAGPTDNGSLLNVDPSAGTVTITINASAATLGAGWYIGIRHDGTANQVKLITTGSDTFNFGSASTTAFALTGRGQTVWMTCDGVSSFKIDSVAPPLIGGGSPVLSIVDRLSAPPGSPAAGARYILLASPSGAWATFAQHDIAEANGQGGWFKYTPPSNSGWLAYVQSNSQPYVHTSSGWQPQVAAIPGVNGLTLFNNSGAPNTKVDVTALNALLTDSAGRGISTGAISLTLDAGGTNGANALDTGSLANNTWYAVWLISNGTTTAGLFSVNGTSPSMPSGYTYKYRVGWYRTNGSAAFRLIRYAGNEARYVVKASSTVTGLFQIASGQTGGVTTWNSIDLSTYAPTTAVAVDVSLVSNSGIIALAPNSDYGSYTPGQTSNPPFVAQNGNNNSRIPVRFVLESTAIFWASTDSANGAVYFYGWKDSTNCS